jgi:fumarylacetoacetase
MIPAINETHDPAIKSWIDSANGGATDFPIQNLAFGVCRRRRSAEPPGVCVAIGDYALDIASCQKHGLFTGDSAQAANACASTSLNPLMALGRQHWIALRRELHLLLRAGGTPRVRDIVQQHLLPVADAEFFAPVQIGDYSDFYASIYHAENVGRLFRPDNPLPVNYKYVPIGYHGRASSLVVSGTPVVRPAGQMRENASEAVRFGPTRRLDYELEMGFYVGPGNALGQHVPIQEAEDHIFGLSLLNDWSARDIQTWEYQPLGPFLAKSFATSVAPWVVTLEALAPFRVPAFERVSNDPPPLPYLSSPANEQRGAIDIRVEVFLRSARMSGQHVDPVRLGRANFRDMYWTIAQLLTHQTCNGCNLRTGDLLASGTISGTNDESRGCLLELTQGGAKPVALPTGETRQFLADGDEVILRASCQSPQSTRIGFGECCGTVSPAHE